MRVSIFAAIAVLIAASHAPAVETRAVKEMAWVTANMRSQPNVNWDGWRFLSFGNIPSEELADHKLALKDMLLSMNPSEYSLGELLRELSPRLWAFNAKKAGWPAEAWEEMSVTWPYYLSLPKEVKEEAKRLTGSPTPVMRADVFIKDGWRADWYVKFLSLPQTKAEFMQKYGLTLDKPDAIGVVWEKLSVSNNPGKIARYTDRQGSPIWARMLYRNARGLNNSREFPTQTACDYNEFLFRLPNGMPGFVSYEGKSGKLSLFSSTDISEDKVSGGVVQLGQSCFACHIGGLRGLKHLDDRSLLKLPQPTSQWLEKVYDKDRMNQLLDRDQERLVSRIENLTGGTIDQNKTAMKVVNQRYEKTLRMGDVAREIGVPQADLAARLHRSSDKEVRELVSAEWSREDFERLYPHVVGLFRPDDITYLRRSK